MTSNSLTLVDTEPKTKLLILTMSSQGAKYLRLHHRILQQIRRLRNIPHHLRKRLARHNGRQQRRRRDKEQSAIKIAIATMHTRFNLNQNLGTKTYPIPRQKILRIQIYLQHVYW